MLDPCTRRLWSFALYWARPKRSKQHIQIFKFYVLVTGCSEVSNILEVWWYGRDNIVFVHAVVRLCSDFVVRVTGPPRVTMQTRHQHLFVMFLLDTLSWRRRGIGWGNGFHRKVVTRKSPILSALSKIHGDNINARPSLHRNDHLKINLCSSNQFEKMNLVFQQ